MPVWVVVLILVALIVGGVSLLNYRINKRASRALKSLDEKLTHALHSWELTDDMLAQWSREGLRELDQEAKELLDQTESLKSDAISEIQDLRNRIAQIIKVS